MIRPSQQLDWIGEGSAVDLVLGFRGTEGLGKGRRNEESLGCSRVDEARCLYPVKPFFFFLPISRI